MPGTPSASHDAFAVLRGEVAAAARRLAAKDLVIGTGGNVSARLSEREIAITATGAELESLEPGQVSLVGRDGELLAGELQPSSELALHLGIYGRYGAGAVVHTHSPYATALSTVTTEVPVVHYSMLALGGAVPVAPYRTFGTRDLAEATVSALTGGTAALMANHGAIVYAQDLHHAVENALLLEWACAVYWRASAIAPPRTLDADEQQRVVEAAISRNYGTTQEAERP